MKVASNSMVLLLVVVARHNNRKKHLKEHFLKKNIVHSWSSWSTVLWLVRLVIYDKIKYISALFLQFFIIIFLLLLETLLLIFDKKNKTENTFSPRPRE